MRRRRLDFDLGLDPTSPESWMMQGSPGVSWPVTAAQLAAAMGYGTWASIWQCDEASGNLTDAVGGITLTATSTPSYRNVGPFSGDFAVGFDSALDRFLGGDVYDSDAVTDIALYMCAKFTAGSGFQSVAGKGLASVAPYWSITMSGTTLFGDVSDGVTAISSTGGAVTLGTWYDILLCIDRTNGRIRIGTQEGLGVDAVSAAVGTANNALDFHIGATTAFAPPTMTVAYAAVATGGIVTLKANMATAISNIRRATGR